MRRAGRDPWLRLAAALALLLPLLVLHRTFLRPATHLVAARPDAFDLDDPTTNATAMARAWARFDRADFRAYDDRVFAPVPNAIALGEWYPLPSLIGYPFARLFRSVPLGVNVPYYLALVTFSIALYALYSRVAGPGLAAILAMLRDFGADVVVVDPSRLDPVRRAGLAALRPPDAALRLRSVSRAGGLDLYWFEPRPPHVLSVSRLEGLAFRGREAVVEESPGSLILFFGPRSLEVEVISDVGTESNRISVPPVQPSPFRVFLEKAGPVGGEVRDGRSGRVVGTTEAAVPRAAPGLMQEAKIVPPTSQNQKQVEGDLRAFVEARFDMPLDKLTCQCEQAVRNYDPCISCATHAVRVRIERD